MFRHHISRRIALQSRGCSPIAKELQSEGIQRYGFHGLSCKSIVHQLANDLPSRLVIAHLGNGASVRAVKGDKSIEHQHGIDPNWGVIMGTRSEDLNSGVLLYLMREKKFDAAMLEELVDTAPASWGFRVLAATCGGCMKPRRQTPMHDLPLRCRSK